MSLSLQRIVQLATRQNNLFYLNESIKINHRPIELHLHAKFQHRTFVSF